MPSDLSREIVRAGGSVPELPELEVVRDVLQARLGGRRIERVTLSGKGGPIVARDLTGGRFAETLSGARILGVARQGKFLLFDLIREASFYLVVNPKLTGRFQLAEPRSTKAGPVHVTLRFVDYEQELRYVDQKRMGQLYLTFDLGKVPTFAEMGPDALQVGPDEFRSRLRRFPGEIKGILAREQFVAGIGNAYADEILWSARLHPYRKRTDLDQEEIDRLYHAVREVLLESIDKVRAAMGEEVHLKPRDFFAVHMRGDASCPRCGGKVSEVTAGGKVTNFCRTCQPGGLIRGM